MLLFGGGGVQSTSIEEFPNNIKKMIGNYNKIAMGEGYDYSRDRREVALNFDNINFDIKRILLIIKSFDYGTKYNAIGVVDSENLPNKNVNNKIVFVQYDKDNSRLGFAYIEKATVDLKNKKMELYFVTGPVSGPEYRFEYQYIAIG